MASKEGNLTLARMSLRSVPAALVASRFVLGPMLVLFAAMGQPAAWVLGVLVVSMLSDIFDGVIARRLGIATAPLRIADSRADAWFFVCVGAAIFLSVPSILFAYRLPIEIEVVIQLLSYAYDIARYGRIASLHAYTAKAWGFTLYVAAAGVLAFHSGAFIWVAFGFGMASAVDALAIKIMLPSWRHDVLSAIHAWRIAQAERVIT